MQSILTKEQYAKMTGWRDSRRGGQGPGMGGKCNGMGPRSTQ
jgi:hypothetical protein